MSLLHQNIPSQQRAKRTRAAQVFGVTSTDFENLAPLVTVCALGTLLPLPLLRLVPKLDDGDEATEKRDA